MINRIRLGCLGILLGMFGIGMAGHASAMPFANVYRAETRLPQDVFANGFIGRGSNRNVLAHVFHNACAESQADVASAWVSTTWDFDRARDFVEGHYRRSMDRIWIYTIRANNDYFSVRSTFDQVSLAAMVSNRGYVPNDDVILQAAIRNSTVTHDREVLSAFVSPRNIESAVLLEVINGRLQETNRMMNPHFDPSSGTGSQDAPPADLPTVVPPDALRATIGGPPPPYPQGNLTCTMTCDKATSPGRPSSMALAAAAPSPQCAVRSALTPLLQMMLIQGGDD